jgi:superfamily II DNA or RNA helicase
MEYRLYEHQRAIIDKNPDKWLFAWGTGSGKTLAAITLAKKKGCPALIICPKSLVEQWKEQVESDWLVLSKEQFKKMWDEIGKYNTICVDEFHYFSNFKSQLTKSLFCYINKHEPQNIFGLTATPFLSTSWNIYTYGKIFGKQWTWQQWNKRYFCQVRMCGRMIPQPKKVIDGLPLDKEMARLVNTMGNTVALEDCFDVPEQIFQVERFNLTTGQKTAIKELVDIQPIVLWTHIHEICGGTLKLDEYQTEKVAYFDSEKTNRCLDLISEHKKIVIVCRYNAEIDMLASKVKDKKVYIIRGDVKNRHEVVDIADKDVNCVVFIQGACSEGYELPSFPIMIFYSYDFSLKNYVQIIGRILRANHLKKNVYISLIVSKTVDEDIWDTVANKKMDFQCELYGKKRTQSNG